ncbi:MAG: PatB family C-S lyase [Pseudorhodobacter sp.]|nr:PatB family C-S lyase [Pseudorhodobacter sp.]
MRFDEQIDRHGTHSVKWDMMEKIYGVPADKGIAMWVADMEFRPPHAVQAAVEKMAAHGLYGYFGDDDEYLAAIRWWMANRHGWDVPAEAIFTTHGLVNGAALCVDAFSAPGDAVVLMTPVYHAFARVIKAAGRTVLECPLALRGGRYELDFAAWDAQMTGKEKLLILCSPHNPGGRVWTLDELRGVADFCLRHDLVFPEAKHTVMALAVPEITDRLIMMTAATKTFNIAGCHTGNVIILDPALRARFAARMNALAISPNAFGMFMTTAAYSPEGAAWVDDLTRYLADNRALFDAGVNAIPGVRAMALEATYLAWVDFSGTGMPAAEIIARVEKTALIAANHGASFGKGGETWLRFNLACPRAQLSEAVARLQRAFADLQ